MVKRLSVRFFPLGLACKKDMKVLALMFGLSEKHTKFDKIFLMVLTNQLIFLVIVKTMRKIFPNYVCFSESPNFTRRDQFFGVFQLLRSEFRRRHWKSSRLHLLGNSLNSTSLCNSMCSSVLSYSIASIFVSTGCGFSGPLCRSLAGSRYGFFHSGHQIQFTQ